jgi:hypothetical protein
VFMAYVFLFLFLSLVCWMLKAPGQLQAYGVWIVSESGPRLRASGTAVLLPVRLKHYWKVDAVGSLARNGADRTVALPLGCALLGTTSSQYLDRVPLSTLYCVSWGYVDASVRVLNLGDAEGGSGVSKVSPGD